MTTPRDIAELVRAPAALSVPGDALAGAAATGTLGPGTAGLSAAAVCLYWAGMAANDWADRDLDARERPGRPIPSGRVTPGAALGTALGLSAAGLALAGLAGGRRALAVAVPLTAAVWCYDLKLKATAAGPAAMAACRGLDVLLGASTSATARPARWPRALPAALTVAAHTYTVTALSRREVTGGGRLLPGATLAGTAGVTFAAAGRVRRPARAARSLAARSLAARSLAARSLAARSLAAWYAASYGGTQLRALAAPDAANVRAAVGTGITCLPALQAALIARSATPRAGPAGVAVAAVAAAAPLGQVLARWQSPT